MKTYRKLLLPKKGEKYNKLTTTGDYVIKDRLVFAEATCECGKTKYYRYSTLKYNVKSCGCVRSRRLPPKGEKYGNFILTGKWEINEHNLTIVEAKCICGKKVWRNYSYLSTARSTGNCGCLNKMKYLPKKGEKYSGLIATGKWKRGKYKQVVAETSCLCGKIIWRNFSLIKNEKFEYSCKHNKKVEKTNKKVEKTNIPANIIKDYKSFLDRNGIKYYFSSWIINNRSVYLEKERLYYKDNNIEVMRDFYRGNK